MIIFTLKQGLYYYIYFIRSHAKRPYQHTPPLVPDNTCNMEPEATTTSLLHRQIDYKL